MLKYFWIIGLTIIVVILLALFFKHILYRCTYFLYPDKKLADEKGVNYPLKDRWIKIKKAERKMEFYSANTLLKSYKIALGRNPVDDKQKEGDKCTPEGKFYICTKNQKSKFHLFLGISYPNYEGAERGLKNGLITTKQYNSIKQALDKKECPPWNTPLGGEIGIHGGGAGRDWTFGCIALANQDIEELYQVLQIGDKVVIEK